MSLATTLSLLRRSSLNILSLFLSGFSALEVKLMVERLREHAPTHSTEKATSSHTPSSPQMAVHTLTKMKDSPMEHTVVQTFCGLLHMNSVTQLVSITLMSEMLSCIHTTLDMYQTSSCSRMILMQFSICTVSYVTRVYFDKEIDRLSSGSCQKQNKKTSILFLTPWHFHDIFTKFTLQ